MKRAAARRRKGPKKGQGDRVARFQINFTSGVIVYPPEEFEGSYPDAKKFAEAQLERYPPGTRYHVRIRGKDPLYPTWAPCDDENFPEC